MITTHAERSFSDWVDEYALTHQVEDVTIDQYRAAIRVVENWASETMTTATISDRLLNGALSAMEQAGRSSAYVRSTKSAVMAVWRDAAEFGLCEPPKKIRRVRCQVRRTEVWSPDEVGRLMVAAKSLSGRFRTQPLLRAEYFESLIRIAWDSGLRRKDLHRLTRLDIKQDFVWTQNKTRKPVRVRLRQATLDLVEHWGRNNRDALWPMWGTDNAFRATWSKLVRVAGIPHGPFKKIRKSAGTAAEMASPGAGHYLLGNTRAVFETSYLDPMRIETPQPPELRL